MHKPIAIASACWLSLSACAHPYAVRVNCDAPLRPINTRAPGMGAFTGSSSASPSLSAAEGNRGHDREASHDHEASHDQ